MAYKFQVGAFRASGSLVAEGDLFADGSVLSGSSLSLAGTAVSSTAAELNLLDAITRGSIIHGNSSGASALLAVGSANTVLSSDGTDIGYSQIDNAMIDNSAAIAFSKLAALNDGNILVGNGSNVATSVAVSGDVALANNGAMTIQANAVEGSMINNNVAGTGVAYYGNQLNVSSSQTTIQTIYNSGLIVGYGSSDANIDFSTDNQIDFDIDGTVEMTLAGGGLSITNGLQLGAGESLDTSGAGSLLIGDVTATSVVLGRSGQEVRVIGDLVVQGTTKSINAATIEITSSFTFEGSSADNFETVLGVVDPTADRTINLADSAGTLVPFAAAPAAGTQITSTPGELNLLDGGTSVGSAVGNLGDSDGVIINDGGTTKLLPLSDIKSYIGAGSVTVTSASAGTPNFALQKGVNYYEQQGGAVTAVLLTGSSMTAGDSIKVKAGADCSVTNTVTITTNGADTIDGTEDHIVLESPNAAVEFVYVADGDYRIF